ncbi:Predicted protein [Mesomycoplasma hyopneumoniae 168]|uniref:Uncharacterized protein n=2 Tax=Mesomycoplasma hyopneumoniae (strain 168) TaxID=907287 RepID=E4QS41_MESH1|nr:Predicted protein [Mesomycoplasma hyopneumoniae 168]AGM21819.1 hypothetical protein MHP168L_040 [Mesomycoplasma hyopneumoniae 168-L]
MLPSRNDSLVNPIKIFFILEILLYFSNFKIKIITRAEIFTFIFRPSIIFYEKIQNFFKKRKNGHFFLNFSFFY